MGVITESAEVDPRRGRADVRGYLGDAYGLVEQFGDLLSAEGVLRGLIGPREVPRLWERHLLNSAAVAPLLPRGRVLDLGSGAGLPGIVLAAMRPDVEVVLLEPMARRVEWLQLVVAQLGLSTRVVRGRAEEMVGSLVVDAVTARAVAPLDRLAGWAMPLLAVDGQLLAMKGSRAADEIELARDAVGRLGGAEASIVDVGSVADVPITRVIQIRKVSPGDAGPVRPALSGARRPRSARAPRGRP